MTEALQIPEGNKRHLPRSPVADLIYKEYGYRSYPRQSNPTVGTNVDIMVPADANRISLLVVNNSSSPVYWGFRTDVSSSNGGILAANGGFLSWDWRVEGEMIISELYAKSTVPGVKVTVFESLLVGD